MRGDRARHNPEMRTIEVESESAAPLHWIDIADGRQEDLARAVARMGANPDLVEVVGSADDSPVVRELAEGLLVVMHGITIDATGRVRTNELDCLIGDRWIITFRNERHPGLEWLWESVESGATAITDPTDVLVGLYETLTRRFIPVVEELETYADEASLRAMVAEPGVLAELQSLLRDEIVVRQALRAQRIVLEQLTVPGTAVPEATRPQLAGVLHLHAALIDDLITARTILSDALAAYRGAIADQTAETTKVLTIYAALVLPLSLVAGIWGMNLEGLPFAGEQDGLVGVLAVMAVVAAVSWFLFRRYGIVSASVRRGAVQTATRLAKAVLLPMDVVMGLRRRNRGDQENG